MYMRPTPVAPILLPVMDRFEELDALICAGLGDTNQDEITRSQFADALVAYDQMSPVDRRAALEAGWKCSNARVGRPRTKAAWKRSNARHAARQRKLAA